MPERPAGGWGVKASGLREQADILSTHRIFQKQRYRERKVLRQALD